MTDSKRFGNILSDNEIDAMIASSIPINTESKSKLWAVKVLNDWQHDWKAKCRLHSEMVVNKSLDEMSPNDLNYTLKHFVFGVRKMNGEKYPGSTIKGIKILNLLQFYRPHYNLATN